MGPLKELSRVQYMSYANVSEGELRPSSHPWTPSRHRCYQAYANFSCAEPLAAPAHQVHIHV